jgi:hypothetical protein
MLRADIEDRQEGGFSERNRKVGPNDAEVISYHKHFVFMFITQFILLLLSKLSCIDCMLLLKLRYILI